MLYTCVRHRQFLEQLSAVLLYNSTPYEGDGGRGWCIVEKGTASAVIAHIAAAKKNGVLPQRIADACAARPKLIDLTAGIDRVVQPRRQPHDLLRAVKLELEMARFSVSTDRALAYQTMLSFEAAIKKAIDAAQEAHISKPELSREESST